MAKFRFQDFKIWQLAIEIASDLFDVADELEQRKLYRFADQLRGAGMSMSNNIAEGAGSSSKKEFKQFLNVARRSTFENANILILLKRRSLMTEGELEKLLDRLDHLCRQITNFQETLVRVMVTFQKTRGCDLLVFNALRHGLSGLHKVLRIFCAMRHAPCALRVFENV